MLDKYAQPSEVIRIVSENEGERCRYTWEPERLGAVGELGRVWRTPIAVVLTNMMPFRNRSNPQGLR